MEAKSLYSRLADVACCVKAVSHHDAEPELPLKYINDEQVGPPQMKCALVFYAGDVDKELVDRPEVVLDDGARYTGQWKGVHFHGKGALWRTDGSYLEGQFDQGQAHGNGKFVAKNGNTYEGQWHRDGAHGFGRYLHEDGSIYEGEWSCNEKNGDGMEKWEDGSHYIGQFLKGQKHGFGFYGTGSGDPTFRGQFQFDKIDGDGTYYFANGRTYSGQWKEGHIHGGVQCCGQMAPNTMATTRMTCETERVC